MIINVFIDSMKEELMTTKEDLFCQNHKYFLKLIDVMIKVLFIVLEKFIFKVFTNHASMVI